MKQAALFFLSITLYAASPQVTGVKNFLEVDERLYRGGQPTAEGFKELSKLGIKTVVDLRGGDPKEKEIVEALGMKYVHIPMRGMAAPTDEQVTEVLKLLEPTASSNW